MAHSNSDSQWRFYKDKDLQELFDPIDLGILKAGETKQTKLWLYNGGVYPFQEINLDPQHPELTIIQSPTELKEKSAGVVIIEWSAKIDTKINLKPKLKIEAYELTPL